VGRRGSGKEERVKSGKGGKGRGGRKSTSSDPPVPNLPLQYTTACNH